MAATYQDLKVWQLAMDMVAHVYRCTATFPKQEMYGLTSQNEKVGCFGSQQYRGGQKEIFAEGIGAVSISSPRIIT